MDDPSPEALKAAAKAVLKVMQARIPPLLACRLCWLAPRAKPLAPPVQAAAPGAVAAAKELALNVAGKVIDEELMRCASRERSRTRATACSSKWLTALQRGRRYTAQQLASVRVTPECEAGMIAIQSRQAPPWARVQLEYPE